MNKISKIALVSCVCFLTVLGFSSFNMIHAMGFQSKIPSMSHYGHKDTISVAQIQSMSGVVPSGIVRLALFSGSNWSEISYSVSQPSVISASVSNFSGRISGVSKSSSVSSFPVASSSISFLMPQPIGVASQSWWSIASTLGLNNRIELVITDASTRSTTTVYLYYQKSGGEINPPPYSSSLSTVLLQSSASNDTNDYILPQKGGAVLVGLGNTWNFRLSAARAQNNPTPYVIIGGGGGGTTIYGIIDAHNVNTPDPASFINDPTNIYNGLFVPSNILGTVYLYIDASTPNDPWYRNIYVDVNGHQLISADAAGSYVASVAVPSSDLSIDSGSNSVSVQITTWVGYWNASTQLNVEYSANDYIVPATMYVGNGYSFDNTAHNAETLNVGVPFGLIASSYLYLTFQDYGDPWCRGVDVAIATSSGTTTLTPSGGETICPGTNSLSSPWTYQWKSTNSADSPWGADLTSLLEFQRYVQVQVTITTECTCYYWTVSGTLQTYDRPAFFDDTSVSWGLNYSPVVATNAIFYDTTAPANKYNNGNPPACIANGYCNPDDFVGAMGATVYTEQGSGNAIPVEIDLTTHTPWNVFYNNYEIDGGKGSVTGWAILQTIKVIVSGGPGSYTWYGPNIGYNSPSSGTNTLSNVENWASLALDFIGFLPGAGTITGVLGTGIDILALFPNTGNINLGSSGNTWTLNDQSHFNTLIPIQDATYPAALNAADVLRFAFTPNPSTYTGVYTLSVTYTVHIEAYETYGGLDNWYSLSNQVIQASAPLCYGCFTGQDTTSP
jgi:hypothetical protein